MGADVLLYRPEEAASVLGIGRNKVFELMATGRLASVQIGRSRRISRKTLEGFVAQLESERPGAA
jgi:excisionase family DNA binding protein